MSWNGEQGVDGKPGYNYDTRNKFLTEAMGECYHIINRADKCNHCSKELDRHSLNQDFSAWEYFGILWEWSQKQKWWVNFLIKNEYLSTREVSNPHLEYPYREYSEDVYEDMSGLINPDRFADAVYEFLKERCKCETKYTCSGGESTYDCECPLHRKG